jgi:hypothetical protein
MATEMSEQMSEVRQRLVEAYLATGWPGQAGLSNPTALRAYATDLATIALEHLLAHPDDALVLATEGEAEQRRVSRSSVGRIGHSENLRVGSQG